MANWNALGKLGLAGLMIASLAVQLKATQKDPDASAQQVTSSPIAGPSGGVGPAGTPGTDGQTPNITIGTVTTRSAGTGATAAISGSTPNLVLSLGVPNGATGSAGTNGTNATNPNFTAGTVTKVSPSGTPTFTLGGTYPNQTLSFGVVTGDTGATGPAGSNAIATAARATTDTSGLYAWTYPASCLNAGHIPALTAIAEGPNPQAGSNVNVQVEGLPTATTASFRVTKTSNTTVALLGLTITVAVTGASIGATVLDLTCSQQ